MKETTYHKICREHTYIKVLGLVALAFLMLVNIAGAAPSVSCMNITVAGAAQDGYQVNITIPWKTGMDSDFSNIRFFSNNSSTDMNLALPYWIESKTAGASANVWVRLPANCNKIVCEWNLNGQTTTKSDGSAVFDIFDDFSAANLDTSKWTILQGHGTITQSEGKLNILYSDSTYPLDDWWGNSRPEAVLALNATPQINSEMIATLASDNEPLNSHAGVCVYQDDANAYFFGDYYIQYYPSTIIHQTRIETTRQQDVAHSSDVTIPRKYMIRYTPSGYSFWENDINSNSFTQIGATYSNFAFNKFVLFGKKFWTLGDLNISFDNFYVKKYSATPPTVTLDPTIYEIPNAPTTVAEFPSIALPIASIIGLIAILGRRKKWNL